MAEITPGEGRKNRPRKAANIAQVETSSESLLDQVAAIMGPPSSNLKPSEVVDGNTSIDPNKNTETKRKKNKKSKVFLEEADRTKISTKERKQVKKPTPPTPEKNEGWQEIAEKSTKIRKQKVNRTIPEASITSNSTAALSAPQSSSVTLIENLEVVNQRGRKKKSTPSIQKNGLPATTKVDAVREQLNEKKRSKARRKSALTKQDMELEANGVTQVGWFSLSVKETKDSSSEEEREERTEKTRGKSKIKKQLRSTVEYSYPHYSPTTREQITVSATAPCYYLCQIGNISKKKRRKLYNISNLFAPREHLILLCDLDTGKQQQKQQQRRRRRIYDFNVSLLWQVIDRRQDKWWIESRLPLYETAHEDEVFANYSNGTSKSNVNGNSSAREEEKDNDEADMQVLSIFFGPNKIDECSNDGIMSENEDDSIGRFSTCSVESVAFSDDDEGADQVSFLGKVREKVEVMPGEFIVLRKEEETYEAIRNGTYMSSLCLGCGKALVSVQDALQVACPSCGSITPLNGICLHRPFGIATGVKRTVCEHLLTARKSIFVAATTAGNDGKDDANNAQKDGNVNRKSTKIPLYIASSRTSASANEVRRIPTVAALGATAMNNRVKMAALKAKAFGRAKRCGKVQ